MAFEPIFAESAPIFVKNSSFHFFKNPHLCLFSWVLEVKFKFQDNSYNRINNNKCLSSEKEDEVCILRKSYFHQIQPTYPSVFKINFPHIFHGSTFDEWNCIFLKN